MPKLNATKIGLITGLLMIALKLYLFYILKYSVENPIQTSIFIIYTVGILWSMIAFYKNNDATKLSAYFSNGFKTFVVVTLLMVAFTWIFFLMHPEIIDNQIADNTKALILERNHTMPEIEAQNKQYKSMYIPMTIMTTIFFYLFSGSIITLISGVALTQMKKN